MNIYGTKLVNGRGAGRHMLAVPGGEQDPAA
jgi:hypothetical protein